MSTAHEAATRGRGRRIPGAAGGFHAILYTLRVALRVGPLKLARAMLARNACKTCALGMGGQGGGMRDELGHFPEVCKKSLQAMAADMQGAVDHAKLATVPVRAGLGQLSPRELEAMGRLTTPMLLREGARSYASIGWDEATKLVVEKLAATPPEATFFYFSGRSSNEAAFLLALLARSYGTNHVNSCSYYCHQASGVGLGEALGTGTSTIEASDLERADLFFLIGGNPASNHPRLMTHLMRLRRRGGRVVVVNPVRETGLVRFRIPSDVRSLLFGTEIATDYVQVRVGGDAALLAGLAKATLARGAEDRAFLAASAEGEADFRARVEALTWPEIEAGSGVARAEIERLAGLYAASQRAVFSWTMGVTHHLAGSDTVRWIADVALLRGMVGKPGAGLLPIRGHSNVQGIATAGVTPALRDQAIERYQALGVPVPAMAGLDTMGCMEAAHAGKMRVGVALGGNLFGANPDATWAAAALAKLDLMVYLNTSLNTGHAQGLARQTLVLPVLARDEEPYRTTQESMFNFVRLSEGGKPRHVGPRGEVEIVAEWGARLLPDFAPVRFRELADAAKVRALIARLAPGLEGLARIDATKQEFQIPGRVLHAPRFGTPTGKARLGARPLPRLELADGELALMTVRSEGQFNTVVFEDTDVYRGQERRDVILMSPAELARRGLVAGDLVRVESAVGQLSRQIARPFAMRDGAALMYYPEANVLVPRAVDPRSKTPAFKHVPVRVVKE
jgi:molybdopterin-dependent oxidoreductase alpha subunit